MGLKIAGIVAGLVVIVVFFRLYPPAGAVFKPLFPVGETPQITFNSLTRSGRPNQFLVCPQTLCGKAADARAGVYSLTAGGLRDRLLALFADEPQLDILREDTANNQFDLVQRSPIMRFPDVITVRIIPLGPAHSTLAIYSRSIYGYSDLGVNRARVTRWLERLAPALQQ
jgi:uncharacterized protein (DUF1499 family)